MENQYKQRGQTGSSDELSLKNEYPPLLLLLRRCSDSDTSSPIEDLGEFRLGWRICGNGLGEIEEQETVWESRIVCGKGRIVASEVRGEERRLLRSANDNMHILHRVTPIVERGDIQSLLDSRLDEKFDIHSRLLLTL
ncbi:hypothetical protein CRG98_037282 [Punica granatum]|uniref:Uncharacterized protein n=1 Tax=Punica granatum TaxID=22663 RepID=A0A2I0IEA3_PUNGR|nr:hypothetical protein CRG98_037282 [Punica granatum]